jgi:hypothetical protein
MRERFVIQLLWLQGLSMKVIPAQLLGTLTENTQSLSTVYGRLRRFKKGNILCEDAERSVRQMIVIGNILCNFLAKYPFASAKIMLQHFGLSASTKKELLIRESGFKKYARRWVPHSLDAAQDKHCQLSGFELLTLLCEREPFDVNGVVTEDDSLFQSHNEPREMFAPSRKQVTPYVRTELWVHNVTITVFFTAATFIVNEALPMERNSIKIISHPRYFHG